MPVIFGRFHASSMSFTKVVIAGASVRIGSPLRHKLLEFAEPNFEMVVMMGAQ